MKLHQKAQAIASVPVTFSISGPVPTQEHIDSRLDELSPVVQGLRHSGYVMAGLLVISVMAFMYFLTAVPAQGWPDVLAGLLPTLGVVIYSAWVLGISDKLLGSFQKEAEQLAKLEPAYFPRMLELCLASPEGAAYRAAVLEQGREFTYAEYHMLRIWSAEVDAREVRAALYGEVVEG